MKKIIYKILDWIDFYSYKLIAYYRFKKFGFKIVPCYHCQNGISEWEITLQNGYNIYVCEFCRNNHIYIKAKRLESKWLLEAENMGIVK